MTDCFQLLTLTSASVVISSPRVLLYYSPKLCIENSTDTQKSRNDSARHAFLPSSTKDLDFVVGKLLWSVLEEVVYGGYFIGPRSVVGGSGRLAGRWMSLKFSGDVRFVYEAEIMPPREK